MANYAANVAAFTCLIGVIAACSIGIQIYKGMNEDDQDYYTSHRNFLIVILSVCCVVGAGGLIMAIKNRTEIKAGLITRAGASKTAVGAGAAAAKQSFSQAWKAPATGPNVKSA